MRTATRACLAFLCFVLAWACSDTAKSNPPIADQVTASSSKETARPWSHIPNQCETFDLVWSDKLGRHYHKRNRHKWGKHERQRSRDIVRLVAKEMGADPRYFLVKSMIESTNNPEALHVLNPDHEANKAAWFRYTWTAQREKQLREIMTKAGKQKRVYYAAKAELGRRTRYKGNPYWEDTVDVDVRGPGESRAKQTASIWSYGYGLYGHNAVGFTKYWDKDAPPWVLCAHDGVVATVIQVWAARRGLESCVSQGFPRTYDTMNRRLSRGHCDEYQFGKAYLRFTETYNLDRDAAPKLGTNWPRETADRQALLTHMLQRVEEECLTRELYERKACTNRRAMGFVRKPVDGPRDAVDGNAAAVSP